MTLRTRLTLLLTSLFVLPVVRAQTHGLPSIFEPIVHLIGPGGLAGVYELAPLVWDSIFALVIFVALAQFALKDRFGGKSIPIVIGIVLALGFSVFQVQSGFRFTDLAPLAVIAIFAVLTFGVYRILHNLIPINRFIVALASFTLVFWFLPPSVLTYLEQAGPVFSWISLAYSIGVLVLLIWVPVALYRAFGGGGRDSIQLGRTGAAEGIGKIAKGIGAGATGLGKGASWAAGKGKGVIDWRNERKEQEARGELESQLSKQLSNITNAVSQHLSQSWNASVALKNLLEQLKESTGVIAKKVEEYSTWKNKTGNELPEEYRQALAQRADQYQNAFAQAAQQAKEIAERMRQEQEHLGREEQFLRALAHQEARTDDIMRSLNDTKAPMQATTQQLQEQFAKLESEEIRAARDNGANAFFPGRLLKAQGAFANWVQHKQELLKEFLSLLDQAQKTHKDIELKHQQIREKDAKEKEYAQKTATTAESLQQAIAALGAELAEGIRSTDTTRTNNVHSQLDNHISTAKEFSDNIHSRVLTYERINELNKAVSQQTTSFEREYAEILEQAQSIMLALRPTIFLASLTRTYFTQVQQLRKHVHTGTGIDLEAALKAILLVNSEGYEALSQAEQTGLNSTQEMAELRDAVMQATDGLKHAVEIPAAPGETVH